MPDPGLIFQPFAAGEDVDGATIDAVLDACAVELQDAYTRRENLSREFRIPNDLLEKPFSIGAMSWSIEEADLAAGATEYWGTREVVGRLYLLELQSSVTLDSSATGSIVPRLATETGGEIDATLVWPAIGVVPAFTFPAIAPELFQYSWRRASLLSSNTGRTPILDNGSRIRLRTSNSSGGTPTSGLRNLHCVLWYAKRHVR